MMWLNIDDHWSVPRSTAGTFGAFLDGPTTIPAADVVVEMIDRNIVSMVTASISGHDLIRHGVRS
jgi:hypothetical protein